jgi:hypothetical protein
VGNVDAAQRVVDIAVDPPSADRTHVQHLLRL